VLEPQWLTWLGRISYGVYLWHILVIDFSGRLGLSGPLKTIFVVTVTLAVASLSYYQMELPILRFKDRIGHDPVAIRQFFQQIIMSFSKRIGLEGPKENGPRT
jgi:peptidoglycan/LPS O-acetylase OafA/YrhL